MKPWGQRKSAENPDGMPEFYVPKTLHCRALQKRITASSNIQKQLTVNLPQRRGTPFATKLQASQCQGKRRIRGYHLVVGQALQ